MPAQGRHPSAYIISIGGESILMDCGEGTQLQMSRYGINRNKINHICISHLHGDHVFGLAGLITSYNHLNRKADLHIHGTPGIREMIQTQIRLSGSEMRFNLIYHEYEIHEKEMIVSLKRLNIAAFPLQHRIATIGYVFEEKNVDRPLKIEEVKKYDIDVSQYKNIISGQHPRDRKGVEVDFKLLSDPPRRNRSIAYCSDTIYDPNIVAYIRNVDILYHEATFLHEKLDLAVKTKHSTAHQAALIAHNAKAQYLLIGHYSSRYPDITILEDEAQAIFANSTSVKEGYKYGLNREGKLITISCK